MQEEESVRDYPRPPRVEPVSERLRVEFAGVTVAETTRGMRVCETASAPVYYFPPDDVKRIFLQPMAHTTLCEWKGEASYWTLSVRGREAQGRRVVLFVAVRGIRGDSRMVRLPRGARRRLLRRR